MKANIKKFKFGKEDFYLVKVESFSKSELIDYQTKLATKNIVFIQSITNNKPVTSCYIPDLKIEDYISLETISKWIEEIQ